MSLTFLPKLNIFLQVQTYNGPHWAGYIDLGGDSNKPYMKLQSIMNFSQSLR